MKQLSYLFIITIALFYSVAQAQNIPNSGFENWTQQFYFSDPVNFWTTNFQSYFSGAGPNAIKTTDAYSGNFALRLEGVAIDTNVLPGAAAIGNPGPDGFSGGYPYNELPDSLAGYAKYNVAPGDSAFVLVLFSVGGSPIAASIQQFTGNQAAWSPFKIPIASFLPVEPDSFIFLVSTSQNFDSATAGNLLILDELHFIGSATPFPNGGFENWTDVISEEPDGGWLTSNFFNSFSEPSVTKTSDAYSGNYAIRLENKPTLGGPPNSFAILGDLSPEGPPHGGFPLVNQPIKISGYYKYSPLGADSSIFIASFSKWNSGSQQTDSLGTVTISLPAAGAYTYFEIPFDTAWTAQADTMLFGFSPSYLDVDSASITLGSLLQVDELALEFVSGVVVRLSDYLSLVDAFPNPASNVLHLNFALAEQTPIHAMIFNEEGKNIKSFDAGIKRGEVHLALPVNDLNAGHYFFSILTERGRWSGKFIVR
ncbi:MAG: T9SS type A sorting domain-containing protein [Bacteroidota bacterium]